MTQLLPIVCYNYPYLLYFASFVFIFMHRHLNSVADLSVFFYYQGISCSLLATAAITAASSLFWFVLRMRDDVAMT